jgi:hypothetical protein
MNRICHVCGKRLVTKHSRQKVHLGECQKEFKRDCARKAYIPRKRKVNNCMICGGALPGAYHKNCRFHKGVCSRKNSAIIERERRRKITGYTPDFECVICKTKFDRVRHNDHTCSPKCKTEHRKNIRGNIRHIGRGYQCAGCGKEFILEVSTTVHCNQCIENKLQRAYIAVCLGLPISQCPASLIADKRAQLKYERAIKNKKQPKTKNDKQTNTKQQNTRHPDKSTGCPSSRKNVPSKCGQNQQHGPEHHIQSKGRNQIPHRTRGKAGNGVLRRKITLGRRARIMNVSCDQMDKEFHEVADAIYGI